MRDIYQLKISIDRVRPSVYRTVLVEDNTNFADLHLIIQIAMGWENYHIYQFINGRQFIREPDEFTEDDAAIDPNDLILKNFFSKKGDSIKYEYDFGDGWIHTVKLAKILPFQLGKHYPVCISGKRACPPEDCGGVWGYANLKEVISDKKHPEYKEMMEWLEEDFDPEYFDIKRVNRILDKFEEL